MSRTDIAHRFNYHKPSEDKASEHQKVRDTFKAAAMQLEITLPDGREKALALTKLEEGMFWANAAIARF